MPVAERRPLSLVYGAVGFKSGGAAAGRISLGPGARDGRGSGSKNAKQGPFDILEPGKPAPSRRLMGPDHHLATELDGALERRLHIVDSRVDHDVVMGLVSQRGDCTVDTVSPGH